MGSSILEKLHLDFIFLLLLPAEEGVAAIGGGVVMVSLSKFSVEGPGSPSSMAASGTRWSLAWTEWSRKSQVCLLLLDRGKLGRNSVELHQKLRKPELLDDQKVREVNLVT